MVRTTDTGMQVFKDAPPLMQDDFVSRFSNLQEWEQHMILSAIQCLASLTDAMTIEASPFLATNSISTHVETAGETGRASFFS